MTLRCDSPRPSDGGQGRRGTKAGFRQDLEGLRAVAVLAVVLFHAGVPGVGGGFVGVDVFFVISGFLITGLLWRELSTAGRVRLAHFYGARARRLLPASATVGVITAIASALWLPSPEARDVLMDGVACAFYVGNYRFIDKQVDYFGGNLAPSPFQHYWSLGVEEQFYLLWPALIIITTWLILRTRRRAPADAPRSTSPYLVVVALTMVVSFALSLMITYLMPLAAFFSLPTRAWQLAVGGLVALTADQWRRLPGRAAGAIGWCGLALILGTCFELSSATMYPGTAALVPTLGATLVIGTGCAAPRQGCGRVLARPLLGAIGRLSYSWYLWHWPVLVLAPAVLSHRLGLVGKLVAVLLAGGLAILTLRFIENPVRFAARARHSSGASLAVGGAATSLAGGIGAVLLVWVSSVPAQIVTGHGAQAAALTITPPPEPTGDLVDAYDAKVRYVFAQVQAAVAASAERKAVPSNLNPQLADAAAELSLMLSTGCLLEPWQGSQPECAAGDTTSKTTVALVGDSNAAMWNPAFRQISEQRHWRLETMTKAACPIMDLPTANRLVNWLVEPVNHCVQWRDQVIARLRAERPQLIVIGLWHGYVAHNSPGWLSGFTSYDPAWIDSITRLVRQLRETDAQVLMLGPVPRLAGSAPICLSEHLDDATACSPLKSIAMNQPGNAAEAAATTAGGGQYADLTQLFCTTNSCPVIVGNTLVYADGGHLTFEYSRQLAPAIEALTDRALTHH